MANEVFTPPSPVAELRTGHRLSRYRFVGAIGQGTTATVWQVETTDINPTIELAAKVFFGDNTVLHGARQEAIRLNEISSKHVVQLMDFREFLVVDAEAFNRLGRPQSSSALVEALAPWRELSSGHLATADVEARLGHYADRVFEDEIVVPNPPLVASRPTGGAMLVQTLCSETLDEYWRRSGQSLSETHAVQIVGQVVEALRDIHALPGQRPHLDVKLDNVLRREADDAWMLGDFGLVSARSRVVSGEVAPWYLALPDFRGHRASDMWLIGVMLHQLITGLIPLAFSGMPLQEIPQSFYFTARELARLRAAEDGGSGVWIHPGMSDELRQLIADCLQNDPRRRPTAAELDTRLGNLHGLADHQLAVGRHLASDDNVRVSANDAAWVLGYDSVSELTAAGVEVTGGQVAGPDFLAASPALGIDDPDATYDLAVTAPGSVRPYGRPSFEPSPASVDSGVSAATERPRVPRWAVAALSLLAVCGLAAAWVVQRATADDAGDQETASTSPTVTETATAASLTESEPESESSSVALGSEPKLTTAWADDGSLQVDWEPVAGADSYQLRLAKLPFVVVDGETTDYVLTSFKPGQNYLLELLVRDGDGAILAAAVEAVTAPGVDESSPNAELNVEQVSVVRRETSATVSWTQVANNEGYGVFVDGRWVEPTAVKDQTTYELTDLDPDQNYLVSVRTSTLTNGLSQRVPAVIPAHR